MVTVRKREIGAIQVVVRGNLKIMHYLPNLPKPLAFGKCELVFNLVRQRNRYVFLITFVYVPMFI